MKIRKKCHKLFPATKISGTSEYQFINHMTMKIFVFFASEAIEKKKNPASCIKTNKRS